MRIFTGLRNLKMYTYSLLIKQDNGFVTLLLQGGYKTHRHIPIYKSISISDVEPFDSAKDFGG